MRVLINHVHDFYFAIVGISLCNSQWMVLFPHFSFLVVFHIIPVFIPLLLLVALFQVASKKCRSTLVCIFQIPFVMSAVHAISLPTILTYFCFLPSFWCSSLDLLLFLLFFHSSCLCDHNIHIVQNFCFLSHFTSNISAFLCLSFPYY